MLISDRLGGENVMLNLMLIYNIYKDALAHYVSYFFSIARSAMGALAYVADSRGKVHIPPEK